MDPAKVLYLYGLSDIGNRRLNNEDAWWAGQPGGLFASMDAVSGPLQLACDTAPVAAMVCDGVGGANAGEMASQLAVTTLSTELAARRAELVRADAAGAAILSALQATDAAVKAKAAEPEYADMGATVSLLCFTVPGVAWWGQAGDSRIYRYHAGRLKQVSRDHSPVGRMRQSGRISEEEARRHPMRNQIDQSLGDPINSFRPDVAAIEVTAGDIFLLCSDGFTDGLWEREVAESLGRLRAPAELEAVVQEMVARSKQASGRDNLTALVCLVEAPAAHAVPSLGAAVGQKIRRWLGSTRDRPPSVTRAAGPLRACL
jgi:protein phosphatase